jgi:hypothetical protein
MRVDFEGPGLCAVGRRQLRRRPRVPRTGRDRIVMNVLMPLNAVMRNNDERSSIRCRRVRSRAARPLKSRLKPEQSAPMAVAS